MISSVCVCVRVCVKMSHSRVKERAVTSFYVFVYQKIYKSGLYQEISIHIILTFPLPEHNEKYVCIHVYVCAFFLDHEVDHRFIDSEMLILSNS